jgi:hypothetical protein
MRSLLTAMPTFVSCFCESTEEKKEENHVSATLDPGGEGGGKKTAGRGRNWTDKTYPEKLLGGDDLILEGVQDVSQRGRRELLLHGSLYAGDMRLYVLCIHGYWYSISRD